MGYCLSMKRQPVRKTECGAGIEVLPHLGEHNQASRQLAHRESKNKTWYVFSIEEEKKVKLYRQGRKAKNVLALQDFSAVSSLWNITNSLNTLQ